MKLAWLVRNNYGWGDDDEDNPWQIVFEEPERYGYNEIKPIVYAEIG